MALSWMELEILAEARRRRFIDLWDAGDAMGAPMGHSRLDRITRDGVDAVAAMLVERLCAAGLLRKYDSHFFVPV